MAGGHLRASSSLCQVRHPSRLALRRIRSHSHRQGLTMADIKVYGAPWCPDCKRSKKFLAEHRIPYEWIDIDDRAEALRFVETVQKGGRTIPTILFPGGSFLLEPSDEDLARKLGLKIEADRPAYDLVIIGGGPAGLAAVISAAREGIDAVVIDRSAMGGQAGVAQRIDNYPGFPEGGGGAEPRQKGVAEVRR